MAISTQSFSVVVSNIASAIQGAANSLIDFTVGSVLRAIAEAVAAITMWLQGIALQILALARFATSSGADADSWGAQFQFFRLPARASTGPVTLARNTTTAQATIKVCTVNADGSVNADGFIVQTQDGSEQFGVVADTNQSAFSATLNAYVIAASVGSCSATVIALTPGASSNVAAGTINTLGSSIPGVDSVTNASAFTDGADAESDPAYKGRFPAYIASLTAGTLAAIQNAIQSIEQNLTDSITENQNFDGSGRPGFFYAVIDDGSGAPSSTLLNTVGNAVEVVRPLCSSFAIFPPSVLTANISMALATAPGYTHSAVVTQVIAAITEYVNTLIVGADLPYSRLSQLAYDASPGVQNVTGITLNGGVSDLITTAQQVIKCGAISVT